MKIQKVVLKEMVIEEVNGEFEKSFINEKVHPAFLTNASVKRGFDEGLLESSLWEDLLAMKTLQAEFKKKDKEQVAKTISSLDEQKFIAIIYLGVLGANKNLTMTFDEFLEKYHEPFPTTIETYAHLITSLVSQDTNQFTQRFDKAAKKNKKKHQQKK